MQYLFRKSLSALVVAFACHCALANAQEIFLRSDWLINVASPAAAIWAGGNESSGTTKDSPNAGGICLAESAIGQITAQSAGYPNADADLAAVGDAWRTAGNAYKYNGVLPGGTLPPATSWNIVFPGGFDPANGEIYGQTSSNNYVEADIALADYYLRARLEVNPADLDAAGQLVLLAEDKMLPYEWAGTTATAYASYARIIGKTENGTNSEILAIEAARVYLRTACETFADFLGNPINAKLVEGLNPLVSSGVTNQVARLVDDYVRILHEYAEACLTDFQLLRYVDFYDPIKLGDVAPQSLLTDIDKVVNEIQFRLLLVSPFQASLPPYSVYTANGAGQVVADLRDLKRLHQSILLGRITFNTGASGSPGGNPLLNYGEFTTAFVPFFTSLPNPGNSSFDVALSLAEQFIPYAAQLEGTTSNDVVAVLQRQYDWTSDQQNLQNQYNTQLENLCGYQYDTNNNKVPDIFFAALPPGVRETIANQVLPGGLYQLNDTGTIYQQWQMLESAETNLLKATIQLNSIYAEILTKTQVANAIYSNQIQLAALILTNGQQIASIDQQQGQIQAQADQAIAQIQATTAQETANNSFWAGIASTVSSAAEAYFTGGASAVTDGLTFLKGGLITGGATFAGGLVNAFATQANGYDQASADLQLGQVEAKAATEIADLNAQIALITANEQAQAEYVQADTTLLQLSADIASREQQANSQGVQIQLAAQEVDQERSKLANMMSQVGSLLNQWMRSVSLVTINPEFTSDLLLSRDAAILQLDNAYTLAQEWAFLAALCFNYLDNCPQDQINYNFIRNVLQARNTTELQPVLNLMKSARTLIGSGCQSSVVYDEEQFSIRNNFVQANRTTTVGTNTVIVAYEPVLYGGTILNTPAASFGAWTNYLIGNLITNKFGERVLLITFSTSLASELVGGVERNPLWTCSTFGSTIYSGSDNNGNQIHGLQAAIITEGFNPPNPQDGIKVELIQAGTSVVRTRGFGNATAVGPSFRYFNFGYFPANFTASLGDTVATGTGTAAFQDRSPANTEWQLSINANASENNGALLANLAAIYDIQLQFGIRSFVDADAAAACNQE